MSAHDKKDAWIISQTAFHLTVVSRWLNGQGDVRWRGSWPSEKDSSPSLHSFILFPPH